jgi:Ca2+-binding RTX toxin-like protein
MAITASVTDGVLLLTGTASGNVVATYNAARLVTVTEGGTPVPVTGGNQPVLSINSVSLTANLTVQGSAADDQLQMALKSGSTTILGGAGRDTLVVLDDGISGLNDYTISGIEVLTGSTGDDLIRLGDAGNTVRMSGVESVIGGSGIDHITLSDGNDTFTTVAIETLDAGAGNDLIILGNRGGTYTLLNVETLFGGSGVDHITLSDGNDTILTTIAIETLDAGAGNDRISLGNAGGTYTFLNAETVIGGTGIDSITVVASATNVATGGGDDTIVGSALNDTINGGAGVDRLTGGGGTDFFRGTASELSGDSITDLGSGDSITVTDAVAGAMTAALIGDRLVIDPDGATGTAAVREMTIGNAPVGRLSLKGQTISFFTDAVAPTVSIAPSAPLTVEVPGTVRFTFSEAVEGFSLSDVLTVNGTLANLVRLDAVSFTATFIPATAGAAAFVIGAGTYEDGAGNAGLSASLVVSVDAPPSPPTPLTPLNQAGTLGSDNISGTALADTFAGLAGNDTISAGDGQDMVLGGSGSDVVSGDAGNDTLWGEVGNDVLEGAAGDDQLWGGTEHDTLSGGLDNDLLKGESGNDVLTGDDGNDTLWGGVGNDGLTGGGGEDIFVFDSKANTRTNKDKIADFSTSADTIWLDNKVFTKLGKGSEAKPGKLTKAFFTVGDKAKDANDYLIYNKKTGVLFYDADGAGKGKAIEIALLSKNLKLAYSDFFII